VSLPVSSHHNERRSKVSWAGGRQVVGRFSEDRKQVVGGSSATQERSVPANLFSVKAKMSSHTAGKGKFEMHIERVCKPDTECQLRAIALLLGIRVRAIPQKKKGGDSSSKKT